jgi:peptide/nickel transport system substrate-binding protein
MRLQSALTIVLALVVACDRRSSPAASDTTSTSPGGSLVAAIQTEVGQVLPPTIEQVDQKLVADQIFEPLAWLGDDSRTDGGFRPALADGWTWERDSMGIAFHLNPKARWHDGAPVRALDVRFTFSLYTDPAVGAMERDALMRVDSVTVRDSVTPVFWFRERYPDQLYDAATRMLIVPEHLLAKEPRATLKTAAFGRSPVGSGRFRLYKWTPTSIELVSDTTHYRGRARLDRVIFTLTSDQNLLVPKLAAGEIDVAEIVNAEQFRTLAARPELNARIMPAFDYSFLHFNLRDPKDRSKPNALFGDLAFRRALTMAIDRDRIVRSQFDTLGVLSLGPMTRAQALADTSLTPIRYDSAGAARLLDSLGWKLPPGKTVRERAGKPLRFSVIVPSISNNRMKMAVRLEEAFRAMGIEMKAEVMDAGAFIARLNRRDFDAALNGVHAELGVIGLRPNWSVASARSPNGKNYGNYENPAFDAHLDSAIATPDFSEARAQASKAFATIAADAPAIWLYELRSGAVVHKRFRTAHVIPSAWWIGLADWSVPPAERIDRDRVGLRVAAQ